MNLFVLFFSFVNFSSDSLLAPPNNPVLEKIVYEASITTFDGAVTNGFLTNIDDSSVSISSMPKKGTASTEQKFPYTYIVSLKLKRLTGNRAGAGFWKGALIGFGTGALIGLASGDDSQTQFFHMSAGEKALGLGIILGLLGLIIGSVVGAFSKKKYKFMIQGDQANFNAMLKTLK